MPAFTYPTWRHARSTAASSSSRVSAVSAGGRRLLDELLVAPLDRALPLAEREHAAVRVAENLDLDVPGRHQGALEVERAVAEGGFRLGARRGVGGVQLVGRRDEPHPLAAATRRRLEQHRVADLRRRRSSGIERLRSRRCPARAARPRRASPPWPAPCRRASPSPRPDGPMKTRSLSAQARAKSAFSARNP